MIYTHGLDQSINHIMVYDGNTPIQIIRLFFLCSCSETPLYDDECNEEAWIVRVSTILHKYATKYNIPYENLSAKPIKITNEIIL